MTRANRDAFHAAMDICEELEQTKLAPRVRTRLANAFDRAIDKVVSIKFANDLPEDEYLDRSIRRHAERGVRDFVP